MCHFDTLERNAITIGFEFEVVAHPDQRHHQAHIGRKTTARFGNPG